ncbi:MAG: DUF2007 domain-containing protein [Methyloligellaceae bacterium]
MEELIRTNNPVSISFIQSLLKDSGIEYVLLDTHMSIMDGSLGILPQRIMVTAGDLNAARKILKDADIEGIPK